LLGHLWRPRSFLVSVWSTSMTSTPMKKCWRIGRTNWRITSGIPGFCKKHWDLSGYGSIPIHTIFRGMNIHLPAILMFTRGIGFWLVPKWINPGDDVFILFSPWLIHRDWGILGLCVCFLIGPGSAQGFACQDLASYHHRFPIWLLAWCAIVCSVIFHFFFAQWCWNETCAVWAEHLRYFFYSRVVSELDEGTI
jgi:hypothetical protein